MKKPDKKKLENSQKLQWACYYGIIASQVGYIIIWVITGVMLNDWLAGALSAFTAIILGLIGKNAYDNGNKFRYDYVEPYTATYDDDTFNGNP